MDRLQDRRRHPGDLFWDANFQGWHSTYKPEQHDIERINLMNETVSNTLNMSVIESKLKEIVSKKMSPPAFRYMLLKKAKECSKKIILPEATDSRVLKAALICLEKGIANCVLLGNRAEIEAVAERELLSLPSNLEIINSKNIEQRYVDTFVEARKGKGVAMTMAHDILENQPIVLATVMLYLGEVDGLVAGAVGTTADTIRPAFQIIKTKPSTHLVSSVFFMCLEKQVLVYGDCAVNPDPDANALAEIAIQSADTALKFDIEPRIAMISYSTGTSGSGQGVDKVREATAIVRLKRPDLLVDGPLQYDAAVIESVAKLKAPDSKVAGKATVCIFPDLNTGNTTYKAVQRSANVLSIGPVLQGLNKPVNDLSRGATVDDIVYTIAITAIQS